MDGLDVSKGHIIFLNFLNTDDRNTVVHDYYYHLLDGVERMDLIYGTEERTRVNVQNFNRDIYSYTPVQNGEALLLHKKMPEKKRQKLIPPHLLYEFEDGMGGVVYRLDTSKGEKSPPPFGTLVVQNLRPTKGISTNTGSWDTSHSIGRNTTPPCH